MRRNPDEYPIAHRPSDSLLPALPLAAEISPSEQLVPRATFDVMRSGRFPLIRIPVGQSWILKSRVVDALARLMTRAGLQNPQRWYDLFAACGMDASLYVMDQHTERYKVIDVEIDAGGETGELILQHLGRRSRNNQVMRVDILDGYGKMIPFVAYREQPGYGRNPEDRILRRYRILVQSINQQFPGAPWREQPTAIETVDDKEEAEYLVQEYSMAYGPTFKVWYELTRHGQRRY